MDRRARDGPAAEPYRGLDRAAAAPGRAGVGRGTGLDRLTPGDGVGLSIGRRTPDLTRVAIAPVIPLVLKKLRVDPAVVSAPMIATLVDGTGLMIYLLIARAMLPELQGL
ncbi:MAG TPA: hypothetical protein DHV14_12465 [Micrococcales bacterium]|nr:hypothetical protein [Micrococcales bacterium]